MIKIHENLQQRTEEWLQAKLGKISASQMKNITGKRGIGKMGHTYMLKLLAEIILQEQEEVFVTDAMHRGNELEPVAREIYSNAKSVAVDEIGGFEDTELNVWYSPDGIVDHDGLIEIKCLQPKNHIETFLSDEAINDYIDQIQTGLWISDRYWCDFVGYNPDFPKHLQMRIIRIFRDEDHIDMIRNRVIELNNMIDKAQKKL